MSQDEVVFHLDGWPWGLMVGGGIRWQHRAPYSLKMSTALCPLLHIGHSHSFLLSQHHYLPSFCIFFFAWCAFWHRMSAVFHKVVCANSCPTLFRCDAYNPVFMWQRNPVVPVYMTSLFNLYTVIKNLFGIMLWQVFTTESFWSLMRVLSSLYSIYPKKKAWEKKSMIKKLSQSCLTCLYLIW